MPPTDKGKGSGVQVHGSIHHFTRKAGRLLKCRRWAYVNQDSLLIFPDAYTSSHCYRIFLTGADVTISYEDEDNPLIAITEPNNHNTYLIQPEKPYKFQKWLGAIHKASRTSSEGFSTLNTAAGDNAQASLVTINETTAAIASDAPDFTVVPQIQGQDKLLPTNRLHTIEPYGPNKIQSKEPPTVPKRTVMSFGCKPRRSQKKPRDNQWTPMQAETPNDSSHRISVNQRDENESPPPRPPRAGMPLKTVKEHPDMKDSDVVPTKSMVDVKNRYPVSGLAKRMSISASDLLGKSRDELILLLLQLNREKANLQRWQDYFIQQIELIRKSKRDSQEARNDIEAIETELKDVNGQLSLSEPLVTFLSNMLRMGDLYGGDDVLFASEYRQHLLSAHEIVPPKPSLTLAREVEAREVARTLNASKRKMSNQPKPAARSSTLTDISCTLANWIAHSDHEDWVSKGSRARETAGDLNLRRRSTDIDLNWVRETASMRQRREQLESELADLEDLCAPHNEIHKRLRETQRSLRKSDRVAPENENKIQNQGTIPHASGPSAALLRRLRSEQSTANRRSNTDSLRARSQLEQDHEVHGLDWYAVPQLMDDSMRRGTDHSGRTTPRRRNKSACARGQGFTPIQDPVNTHLDSKRRYRSIPDHLDLLDSDEANGLSQLYRQKSFEWEPLNRPLNTPRPSGDTAMKFSALQPEVFLSPTQSDEFYRSNFNVRNGQRDSDRSPRLTNTTDAYKRSAYPVDSSSDFQYRGHQQFADSSERSLRLRSLRTTRESIPNGRSIFGYSNERMDRTLEPCMLENGDIPRVVRPYSSNTNELRPNFSSPDLTFPPDGVQFEKLQSGSTRANSRRQISRTRQPISGDRRENICDLVYTELETEDCSPRNWTDGNYGNYARLRRSSERSKSNFDGSHTIQLLSRNLWDTSCVGRDLPSANSIDTESTTKDAHQRAGSPVKDINCSINEWLKLDSPLMPKKSVVNGDFSIEKAETLGVNSSVEDRFQTAKESPDHWHLPSPIVTSDREQFKQPIKPRIRRSIHDYLPTAESIESMFSPPEPMKIRERYVPSPTEDEPSDAELHFNKEAKLNAIRQLLIHQRFSGDFDRHSSPPDLHAENRINHNAHLISMQEKLARDAVASVFQQAESRTQAKSKLSA